MNDIQATADSIAGTYFLREFLYALARAAYKHGRAQEDEEMAENWYAAAQALCDVAERIPHQI